MTNKRFKTRREFNLRENKKINGVNENFAAKHENYIKDNKTNKGCWNCSDCNNCHDCSSCFHCSNCFECFKYFSGHIGSSLY